jgi:hypothetical protein
MSNFDGLIGKFVMLGIVLLSLFSFIVYTQSDNSSTDPLSNNPAFSKVLSNLTSQAQASGTSANNGSNSFFSENPQSGFGSIILMSIVSIGKTFSSLVYGFFSIAIELPVVILGIPVSIYSLLITWLIIIVIVALWLLYKLGG